MKRIFKVILPLLVILTMLFPAIASADVSLSLFSVVESGHITYSQLPIIASISNTTLVAQGKIASDGLNTQVTLNGTPLPHMVADDKTLFVSPILADATTNFVYSTKDTPDISMPIIVGSGGYITTPYNAFLEPLGNNYEIDIAGYVDTSSGSNKYICNHVGEITIQVTGSAQITATINDGTDHIIVLNGVPSGYYSVQSLVNSGGTWTYTIGAYSGNTSGVGTIPDNNEDWVWNQNNVMPYIDSIAIPEIGVDGDSVYQYSTADLTTTGSYYHLPFGYVLIANSICTDGSYLYLLAKDTNNSDDLSIFKVSLSDFTLQGQLDFNYSYDNYDSNHIIYTRMMCLNGDYLYFAQPSSNVDVNYIDKIYTPAMSESSEWIGFNIVSICCDATNVYVAAYGEAPALMSVLESDLSVINNIVPQNLVSSWREVTSVAIGANYLYVIGRASITGNNREFLGAIDKDAFTLITSITPYATVTTTRKSFVEYHGAYVYVNRGGYVDRYSSTLNTLEGSYATALDTTSIAFDSSYLYLSDLSIPSEALLKVDTSMTFVTKGTLYGNSANTSNLAVSGDYLYSSSIASGLFWLQYQPNNIVQGTVLPDLSGNGYDGVITWGSNPAGIAVSNLSAPQVTTDDATNLSTTSATLNGTLNSLGGFSSAVVSFEYGLTTTPQTYPNTATVATPLTAAQSFLANITNLQPNATYHFQAIANVGGVIVYGGDKTFNTTLSATSSITVTISKLGVFQDYTDSGDMLFTAEIFCNYPPYNASGSAFNYFTVELLDTDDTTVIAVSLLQMWGDRPESIYLKPSIASTLTLNGAYHIAVIGLFSGAANPYADAMIQPTDWKGSDKIQLDAWCIETAKDMEVYDNKASGTYVVSSTDNKEVITDTAGASGVGQGAGGWFTTGIPQISVVRPDLFQVAKSKVPVTLGAKNDQWTGNHVWATKMGAQIAADWNSFGALLGVTGANAMGYALLLAVLVICVFGVAMGGKGLPLLVLSFPLTLWGAEMGAVGYQWLLIPCVAMVLLWARQFWVKPT